MDYEAYRNSKDLNPYDIPRTKDGKVGMEAVQPKRMGGWD